MSDTPGAALLTTGGVLAALGGAIILWPHPGLQPDPLPFPPADATGPLSGVAVLGYPLLVLGFLLALSGGLRFALSAPQRRADRRRREAAPELLSGDVRPSTCDRDVVDEHMYLLGACGRAPGHPGKCAVRGGSSGPPHGL